MEVSTGYQTGNSITQSNDEEIQVSKDQPELQANTIERLTEEIAFVRLQLQNSQINRRDENVLSKTVQIDDSVDLSFIIPVYNADNYIEECIKSIIKQDIANYEIICVDDGSTDETPCILARLAEAHPQIKVISQKNQGQGAARNVALNQARGRYVRFVDSDDLLSDLSSTKLIDWATEANLDILFFDADTLYDSEELESKFPSFRNVYKRAASHRECVCGTDLFKQFKKEDAYRVVPWLCLFRRNFLEETGLRFPEGVIYEDNAFMLEAICLAKRVAHINEPFHIRRIREGSTMTSKRTSNNTRSYFEVYLRMLQFALQSHWDYETEESIADELKNVANAVKTHYQELASTERAVLRTSPPICESVFELFINQIDERVKREDTENNLETIQLEKQKLEKDLTQLNSNLDTCKKEIDQLKGKLERSNLENEQSKEEIEQLTCKNERLKMEMDQTTAQNQQLDKKIENYQQGLIQSQTEIESLKKTVSRFKIEVSRSESATEQAKNEIARIKSSNSWKIGRKITAPVRLIKRTAKK